ncbi:hypothetical protein GRI89_10625 [Altererythrobacter salegens]|uniref:Uncharacterized protein n=1 Tax=Croceibacterium salegens TaxID=1737568 RepID=A0A6I4T056_9SPHN|nr:hypothetical protein [Croceibacterium salegens]MXO59992.1 hypothetical protein [Croceibacterium salegens]
MSFAAAFLLAAAAATQAAPAASEEGRGQGAQVASADVSVTILRGVAVRGGELSSANSTEAPRSQVHKSAALVTYEFE